MLECKMLFVDIILIFLYYVMGYITVGIMFYYYYSKLFGGKTSLTITCISMSFIQIEFMNNYHIVTLISFIMFCVEYKKRKSVDDVIWAIIVTYTGICVMCIDEMITYNVENVVALYIFRILLISVISIFIGVDVKSCELFEHEVYH